MIILDDYIPLKATFGGYGWEAVKYFSYSKSLYSLVEFAVRESDMVMKEVTLVICKEYAEVAEKLEIESFEDRHLRINGGNLECSVFQTIFYTNGLKVVLTDKPILKYVKMENVYFGMVNRKTIGEVCVCDMSTTELECAKSVLSRHKA